MLRVLDIYVLFMQFYEVLDSYIKYEWFMESSIDPLLASRIITSGSLSFIRIPHRLTDIYGLKLTGGSKLFICLSILGNY